MSLPILHLGDSVVTGPIHVARYLARLTGLGGKGDLQMIAADDIFAFVESFYESELIRKSTTDMTVHVHVPQDSAQVPPRRKTSRNSAAPSSPNS